MARQPRNSTRSTNPKSTEKIPKNQPFADRRPARAHRDDTPEARVQRARAKTHPTREPRAMRHDTSGGGGGRK